MGGSGAPSPRNLNPLWIISLFLGLSEVTSGVAATQVDGASRASFTLFAIIFPSGVAIAFFAILWRKPQVLYAPRDFPKHLDARAYVQAMQSAAATKQEAME